MRIRTILAAAAAPAALAAVLLGTASQASAATVPNPNPNPNPNSVITISTQAQADQLMYGPSQGVANKSIDVPATADPNLQLRWLDVHGNLTVEGKLSLASSTIEGNVTVSGPSAGLSLFNDPGNTIWGNLTVNGAGGYYDGSWINTSLGVYSNGQQVNGGLTFTNNTGSRMSLNGSMTVNGKFAYSGNALPYAGGLTVGGQQSVS
jgi:hypothetical protein